MSTTNAHAGAPAQRLARSGEPRRIPAVRAYFFSDGVRTVQSALGLIWLLDAGLQFQSFMYSRGFTESIIALGSGQPGWIKSSIDWGAHLAGNNLGFYNTLFGLTQVLIGLGLLYRPAVKHALLLSFAWALFVWWFGEAFGMLFMSTAQPLTGAPGGVLLYLLIGLIVWPNGQPGGLLGVRGTRLMWATLWLLMAYLWLLQSSSSANAIHDAINAAPSGLSWLSSLQDGFASVTKGNGLIFALILAALSAAVAVGVGFNRYAKQLLILAAAVNVLYWLVGQGFGGIFQGGATDPNSGPLFVLMAYAVHQLVPYELSTTVKRSVPPQTASKMDARPS